MTVGQTPRPDLESLFDGDVRLVGALDGVSREAIDGLRPEPDGYPILCRLNDGTTALVERTALANLIAGCLADPLPAEVGAAMVLCTAEFPEISAGVPTIIPGDLLPRLLTTMTDARRIGVVTSNTGQIPAAHKKWTSAGFLPQVDSDDPVTGRGFRDVAAGFREHRVELVVLDCFGHDQGTKDAMAEILDVPIVVAQQVMATFASHLLHA